MKYIRSNYLAHFNVSITLCDNVFFLIFGKDRCPFIIKLSFIRHKKFTLSPGKIIIVSINGGTAPPRHAISHLTCTKINLI